MNHFNEPLNKLCTLVFDHESLEKDVWSAQWNTVSGSSMLSLLLLYFQDEGQLLKIQKMLEEKGDSTRGIKRQLFLLYCRNKDLENAERLVKVTYFIQPCLIKFHWLSN